MLWIVKTAAMVAVLLICVGAHKHQTDVLVPDVDPIPLQPDSDYYSAARDVRSAAYFAVQSVPERPLGAYVYEALNTGADWVAFKIEEREMGALNHGLVRISDRFGMRYHPILKRKKMHNGVDFAAPRGTPIVAVADGTIAYRNWRGGYGRFVKIDHEGFSSSYAHLSKFERGYYPGVEVKAGDVIGYVGASGLATGNHLHFSIMVDGRFVDPLKDGLERVEPLREAQILVDFERGMLSTLKSLNMTALEYLPEAPEEGEFEMVFEEDDSFL